MKVMFILTCVLMLAGCAFDRKTRGHDAYRLEVRNDLQQLNDQMRDVSAGLSRWHPPLVQEVVIPAHVSHGVLVPEHKEIVIIKHGEWMVERSSSYQRKTDNESDIDRPSGRSSDLSILPQVMGRP